MNSKTLIIFGFTDVDENTVIDVIRQLPLKLSFGFDGISSHLLHNIELYLVVRVRVKSKTNLFATLPSWIHNNYTVYKIKHSKPWDVCPHWVGRNNE